MAISKYVELENGDRMPKIGFGTWQASDEELERAVEEALKAGYRHIDTARVYENEAAIGRALKKWMAGDPAKRKELFIVTKLPPSGHNGRVRQYMDESLRELGLEYVDLYLIHTPFAFQYDGADLHPKNPDGSMKVDHSTDLVSVWKEMVKLKEAGLARHIGVSNMNLEQIDRLTAVAKPECLQVEVHLLCQQKALLAACQQRDIPVVAYAPLGSKSLADALAAKSGREYPDLLKVPEVVSIAEAKGKTPAQILLRHLLQSGFNIIPKSTNPDRIRQNIDILNFELSESEMARLSVLDRGEAGRILDFSFFPGVEKHPEYPFKKLI